MSTEVLDRLDFEAIATPRAATATRRRVRWARRGAWVTALLATGGLVGLGVWWGHYRYGHIVASSASFKGYVAQVGARFDAAVASVNVVAGQRVQAGDIVARLEDAHLQALQRQAEAELLRATQRLDVEKLAINHERTRLDARVTQREAEFVAAGARLDAAKSEEDNARREYSRLSELNRSGVSSSEEYQKAQATLRTDEARTAAARADREAADAALRSARAECQALAVREAGLVVFESQVKISRAAAAEAGANLEATVIRAPDSGWVVRRIAEPGASVRVGQPIVALWCGTDLWVEAWIEESDLPQVGEGSEASVTVDSLDGKVLTGHVAAINVVTSMELGSNEMPRMLSPRTRETPMVCLRIALDQVPSSVFPGLSALVSIPKRAPSLLPHTRFADYLRSAPQPPPVTTAGPQPAD